MTTRLHQTHFDMRLSLLLIFTALKLSAATYYIRTDGSDSNAGTTDSAGGAFLTLNHAASVAAAGDTINLGSGNHADAATISTSGTDGNYITVTGASSSWQQRRIILNGSYWKFDGFRVGDPTHVYSGGWGNFEISGSTNLFLNLLHDPDGTASGASSPGSGSLLYFERSSRACIASNNVSRDVNYTKGIYQISGHGHLITANTVSNTIDVDFAYLHGTNITISYNDVSGNTIVDDAGQHSDFFQTFGDNSTDVLYDCIIEGNYMHDSGTQIAFMSQDSNPLFNGITIRNNIFANITSFMGVGITNTAILNNLFYKCNATGQAGGNESAIVLGGSAAYNTTNCQIINNVFLECGGTPSSSTSGTAWMTNNGVTIIGMVHSNNYVGGTSFATKSHMTETGLLNGSDPGFVDESASNFALESTSILRAAGVSHSLVTIDKNRVARPSPPSIGPLEFADSSSRISATLNRVEIRGRVIIR